MKHNWFLPALTNDDANKLCAKLVSHFRLTANSAKWNAANRTLSVELAPIGRDFYYNHGCEKTPIHFVKSPYSRDSIRAEAVTSYVNGFYTALSD